MVKKNISNWIYSHSFVCVAILVAIVFIPYILVFEKNGISHQTQDWSYIGSYIGGTLGVVSIFLLYITYREQRRTNHFDHFEKVLFYHVDNIVKLQERHHEVIQYINDKILGLFLDFECEIIKEQAKRVIQYSYSNLIVHTLNNNRSFEDLFYYIEYSLCHIENDIFISEKSNYVKEISIVLTLESKVVLFCYILGNNRWDILEICDKYNLFKDWNMDNDMFNQVVSMFCNNYKSVLSLGESPFIPDLFKFDDNTTFYDVLDHVEQVEKERRK